LFDSCDPDGCGYVARKDVRVAMYVCVCVEISCSLCIQLPILLVKMGMKPTENNVEKFLELYDSGIYFPRFALCPIGVSRRKRQIELC
jgi:hypothetical protein